MGGSARHTPRALRCCIPNATANSHPIPGLIPWYAPRTSIAFHSMSTSLFCSGVAVRIGRCVTALEANLVRAHAIGLEEERRIQFHSASGSHIHLDHPAADAVRIELVVPRSVESVG